VIQPNQPLLPQGNSDCYLNNSNYYNNDTRVYLGNESNPLCWMLLFHVNRDRKLYELAFKTQADADAFWNAVKYLAFVY